ncbi:hypothetical protein ACH5RR_015485 [Cinchona calisaya]|uniref:Uncharacterized protein n=1 Tax=Cinchona calisaya TaxID=153742 RepID=A0ABD2ZTB6_9GENT
MEDQVNNANMTSSIEIEDKDATGEVEVLAQPTKDNDSSMELDLSLRESIIHSLFELPQEVLWGQLREVLHMVLESSSIK